MNEPLGLFEALVWFSQYFLIGICCAGITLRIVKVYRPLDANDLEVAMIGILLWPLVLIGGIGFGFVMCLKLLAKFLFDMNEEKES